MVSLNSNKVVQTAHDRLLLAQGKVTAALFIVNEKQPRAYEEPSADYLQAVRSLADAISKYGEANSALLALFS